MRFLYNLLVYFTSALLKLLAFLNPKIKKFVEGRKKVFDTLENFAHTKKTTLWIHAASLGEYEQGKPVIEELKKTYPSHTIVLTFFSPSGYEIRKNDPLVDLVCYLPLDTVYNAKRFIKLVQPCMAIFIKYEFWPNYLHELSQQNIPCFLISGIFRKNQSFFKPTGFWMRKHLKKLEHFFVQDNASKQLLNSIDIKQVTIAGDTRFDRVQKTLDLKEKLSFIERFTQNKYTIVAGSTWPKDEQDLIEYIHHKAFENQKIIIAPHNVKPDQIQQLKANIHKKVVLYSAMKGKALEDYQVFIIDTIGILSKIYAYADVAYIGGGYTKSGVHNTLEAATYGVPIVIGPNYKKFKEVQDLVALKGCTAVNNSTSLQKVLFELYQNKTLRQEKSNITKAYVAQNLGATQTIMNTLKHYF